MSAPKLSACRTAGHPYPESAIYNKRGQVKCCRVCRELASIERKRVCRRGHVQTPETHHSRGYCIPCHQERARLYYHEQRRKDERTRLRILPAEPLRQAMRDKAATNADLGRRMDDRYGSVQSADSLSRALKSGWLTSAMGDDAAIALGLHPFQVWPNWFDLPLPESLEETA